MTRLIIKNNSVLAENLYSIDEENKTFSTTETDLIIDFAGEEKWSFKTGARCRIKAGQKCFFNVPEDCDIDAENCAIKVSDEII